MTLDTRLLITAPLVRNRKGAYAELFTDLRRKGYVRVLVDGKVLSLDESIRLEEKRKHDIHVVVDRIAVRDGIESRLTDSVETALREGGGTMAAVDADTGEETLFSEQNACLYCGISLPELSVQLFSFNNPVGMCQTCSGLGYEMKVDPELVIPRPALSIKDGAVAPWGEPRGWSGSAAEAIAKEYGFSLGTPWKRLTPEEQSAILYGTGERRIRYSWSGESSHGNWEGSWEGVIPRIERLYISTSSEDSRQGYERFFRKTPCSACGGARLRPEARSVMVGGRGIHELNSMTVEDAWSFFEGLHLDRFRAEVTAELRKEIALRLGFLRDVGLHYLTLDRAAPSLSGGEAQRIRLASQIGSGLTGVLYVLDEPTIGLHQRDNERLIRTLERLRDLGNSVLVVEHDRDTIKRADHIIDFGPGAGVDGGLVVAEGTPQAISAHPDSITGMYLSGRERIHRIRGARKKSSGFLTLEGARLHNLKDIDVRIPLGKFVCVTGVSGSGKSSLITQTLYPVLAQLTAGSASEVPGPYSGIRGIEQVDKVINISQEPIGRTPRSNPATYTKVFDHIRNVFAELPQAKIRGYGPGRFSFNVRGGRCEDCEGAGVKRIEMHFLPDVFVECQTCGGRRFNRETLRVAFKGHSIAQVLELTIRQAMDLFERIPMVLRILKVLDDVGLGYMRLGQPAPTLSGGEAQRVKLARELARPGTTHTVYILDEPTTGLHFHDVRKLLHVLDRLVSSGNTVIVIEHNLDVVKNADWIIDLGPEGGEAGGMIIAEGTPETVAASAASYTGSYLRDELEA
jgi:excinuclease ABC subunit A